MTSIATIIEQMIEEGDARLDESGVIDRTINSQRPGSTLAAARVFAEAINMQDNLEGNLLRLGSYSDRPTRCILTPDGAPYSFGVQMLQLDTEENWKHWFYGGLIYHGEHDNGGDGSAPTFSVNLSPTTGWALHT